MEVVGQSHNIRVDRKGRRIADSLEGNSLHSSCLVPSAERLRNRGTACSSQNRKKVNKHPGMGSGKLLVVVAWLLAWVEVAAAVVGVVVAEVVVVEVVLAS